MKDHINTRVACDHALKRLKGLPISLQKTKQQVDLGIMMSAGLEAHEIPWSGLIDRSGDNVTSLESEGRTAGVTETVEGRREDLCKLGLDRFRSLRVVSSPSRDYSIDQGFGYWVGEEASALELPTWRPL